MLLIFRSNFAIGFCVLQTIYRFLFSWSPLRNQKWAKVIRLLYLRSWSKPDISSFLHLSPPSLCCWSVHTSFGRWDLASCRALAILVTLSWCDSEFALGELLFPELMKWILPPPCIYEFPKGPCDQFHPLSLGCTFQRASVLEIDFWSDPPTRHWVSFALHASGKVSKGFRPGVRQTELLLWKENYSNEPCGPRIWERPKPRECNLRLREIRTSSAFTG